MSAQIVDRRPPHRVALPLPAGTALCLACWWADASGAEAPDRALVHTRKTSHPTIAARATRTVGMVALPSTYQQPAET